MKQKRIKAMKRKVLFVCAAAGMLLATSCSSDELTTTGAGNEGRVTFSLNLENSMGTRAISDGTGADKLVYAVFDESGQRISGIKKVEKLGVTFPTTETLALAKGQTYQVAFWAQDADCSAYTVSDDMKVTVSYGDNTTAAVNNDETRDAFFACETFTVTGSTSIDVELKRPFAQINVGVTDADWTAAVNSGVTVTQSSVKIKNAATSINLLTGAVDGSQEVTYSLANIPSDTETLTVDTDGDGTAENYKWISMSYILVNDQSTATTGGEVLGAQKATLDGLEFTFKNADASWSLDVKDGLTNVPVQRNWRTNILGQLLSGNISFNISIDPAFLGDNVYPDGSAQELAMVAANGGTVTLAEDVELTEPLVIADGKTVTINLNGHDIINKTQVVTQDGQGNTSYDTYALVANGNSVLNIEGNGNIQATNDDTDDDGFRMAVYAYGNAVVNIKGGNFCNSQKYNAQLDLIYADENAVINISGGTFESKCYSTDKNGERIYWVLNKKDKSNAQINVTGGTFINFDPSSPQTNDDDTYVVEGYTSVKINDNPNTYMVAKKAECNSEEDLKTAANSQEPSCVVLNSGIKLTQSLTFGSDVVLESSSDNLINITGKPMYFNGETTVIRGIKFNNGTDGNESSMYISNNATKSVIIEDCEFTNAKWDNIQLTKAEESVIIRNCTFKNTEQGYRYIHLEIRDKANGSIYATTDATVEVTGCTFENVSTDYCKDSAITICGFKMANMNISGNKVKGAGADNLTTSIIWICDGTNFSKLMSVEDINKAFVYTSE